MRVVDLDARRRVLIAAVTAVLVAAGLLTAAPATQDAPAPAFRPISTSHDGADWVPFVGDYEMWCVQGNPGYSGCASHHNRPAVDVGMPPGTRIRAAGRGTVTASANDGDGRGHYVVITHPDGVQSHYYHLQSRGVSEGQNVKRGQEIGRSGSSGSTSAPHLHYEERKPNGDIKEPGIMYGLRGLGVVRYPSAGGDSDWRKIPYGTRIVNEGYPPYDDLHPDTWNFQSVLWAHVAGVATGYPDSTFRNGASLTRAQIVAWIWRGAGEPAPANGAVSSYPDVPAGAWYKPALDWAAGIPGMLDPLGPEFKPDRTVRRLELAQLKWGAAGRPDVPAATTFSDVDDPAVDWMVALGYMSGFNDGTFRGGQELNRGQAVNALYNARPFHDTPPSLWTRPAVDWARWRTYISGFPDHTFRGDLNMTRAAVVSMVWRSQGSPAAAGASPFTDVTGAWYQDAVDWAHGAGLISGFKDGTFKGDRQLSRGQWLSLLHKLVGSPPVAHQHPWTDVPRWIEAAANWGSSTEVFGGFPDGTFREGSDVTRGQAVTTLRNTAAPPS